MGNKEDKIRVGVVLGSVSDIGKVKDLFQNCDIKTQSTLVLTV